MKIRTVVVIGLACLSVASHCYAYSGDDTSEDSNYSSEGYSPDDNDSGNPDRYDAPDPGIQPDRSGNVGVQPDHSDNVGLQPGGSR